MWKCVFLMPIICNSWSLSQTDLFLAFVKIKSVFKRESCAPVACGWIQVMLLKWMNIWTQDRLQATVGKPCHQWPLRAQTTIPYCVKLLFCKSDKTGLKKGGIFNFPFQLVLFAQLLLWESENECILCLLMWICKYNVKSHNKMLPLGKK